MSDGAAALDVSASHGEADKTVGTIGAVSLSLAGLGPFFTMAFATGFAAKGAGGAVPMSYCLGALGAFALAYVVVKFARHHAGASGVAYTYVGAALGRLAGFVAGWTYVIAWLCGTASVLTVASVSAEAMFAHYDMQIPWFAFFLVFLAVAIAMNLLGVRLSLGWLVVIELASMAFLLAVAVFVIARGGANGNSIRPFVDVSLSATGWSGVFFGMIYGFAGFAGFEAAAALGREVKNKHVVPRAIIVSLAAAAAFYIVVTYSFAIGYGLDNADQWASDASPVDTIVSMYAGNVLAQIADALVVISAMSSALGLVTLTSRTLFEIGSHGHAPRQLARLHHRFRTPYVGIGAAAGVALFVAVALGLTAGSQVLIGFVAGATTLAFLVVYGLMAIGWIRVQVRASGSAARTRVLGITLAVFALVLLCGALYSSVVPQPPFPYNLQPVALGLTLLAAATAGWLLRARGHDLAEPEVPTTVEDMSTTP